jgi:hypothetical protein
MKALPSGHIQFHAWCEPPLTVGDYELKVEQTVDELDKNKALASSRFSFSVGGPRFALDPPDIYSVYPPDGARGDFANSLPHIVFTRRTVPWERNLRTGADPARGEQWLALLLLSEEDFPDGKFPEMMPRQVEDLVEPEKGSTDDVARPRIARPPSKAAGALQTYELTDPCNTIDLDAELFQEIVPGKAALRYLAHVREVKTEQKETLSFLADGWFSVVIGNRFPQRQRENQNAGVENRALLVSLEGMEYLLPAGDKSPTGGVSNSLTAPPAKGKVRLAVLASWTFHCIKASGFVQSMNTLDVGSLEVPFAPKAEELPQAQYVRDAFRRGYAALNHNTRRGEKTVSWYRGPLTPVTIERKGRYAFAAVPDALVRYEPKNGMMDLTYAAAAQLGRLLALQDRSFAQSLCTWRTEVQAQITALMQKEDLRRALNSGSVSPAATESAFLENVLKDALAKTGSSNSAGNEAPQGNPPAVTKDDPHPDFKNSLEKSFESDPDPNPPLAVRQWLAKRLLLYGVPFLYLVPDELMLPEGSMRFFSLDPGWIKCLLEGACSVGRSSTREKLVDEYLRARFFDLAVESSAAVRQLPPAEGAPAITRISTFVSDTRQPARPVGGKPFAFTLTGTNLGASTLTVRFSGPGADYETTAMASGPTGEAGRPVTEVSGEVKANSLPEGSFLVTVKTKNRDTELTSPGFPLTVLTEKEKEGEDPGERTLKRALEGFLLRSPVVQGWPGLEMEATGTGGKTVKPLRIDRLAPDIMLCIFGGPLEKIEIRQPPEGMHFGATVDGGKYRKWILRNVRERKITGKEPGEQINLTGLGSDQLKKEMGARVGLKTDDANSGSGTDLTKSLSQTIEIPLLQQKLQRVVDVAKLARRIYKKLKGNGMANDEPFHKFTSAEFGVQMTESPGRVTIVVRAKAGA